METIADLKTELWCNRPAELTTIQPSQPAVMIIDDNVDIIAALTILLGPHCKVISAMTHDEAMAKLTPDIDVVLLDIKMTGKDGIEVFKTLHEQRPNLKIVFHSAYPGSAEKALEVQSLDHRGYLTKGNYSFGELLETIRGLCC